MRYGLDTNVLARLVLADDREQHGAVLARMAHCVEHGHQVTVDIAVLLELEWVLRSAGKLKKPQVLTVFKLLLDTQDLVIQEEAVFVQALYFYEDSTADFAECLFLARYLRADCDAMLSFDERAQHLPTVEAV
jgi:predicted nucleic-acid-binding protein